MGEVQIDGKEEENQSHRNPSGPPGGHCGGAGGRGFCGAAAAGSCVAHSHEPMNVGRLWDGNASHSGLTLHNQARFD